MMALQKKGGPAPYSQMGERNGVRSVCPRIPPRIPPYSYGVTLSGTSQVLTGESSRECNHAIHRKYLSDAALADPKVGPVFAAWDDITVRFTPESVIAWDMRQADQHVFWRGIPEQPHLPVTPGAVN